MSQRKIFLTVQKKALIDLNYGLHTQLFNVLPKSVQAEVIRSAEPNHEIASNPHVERNENITQNVEEQSGEVQNQAQRNEGGGDEGERNVDDRNEQNHNEEYTNEEEQWFEDLNISEKIKKTLKTLPSTSENDRKFVNLLIDSSHSKPVLSLISNITEKKAKLKSGFRDLKEYSSMKSKTIVNNILCLNTNFFDV